VLNPLSGYLVLAQRLWDDAAAATAWNFGPAQEEARPVSHLLDRLSALSPDGLEWQHDAGEHPHEATYLKVDSSRARAHLGWAPRWGLERALESIVEWYGAHRAGGDVRALTHAQLEAFQR
jgi:CDP-glucose 4,6-dehydratase